jgi:hypothetical protein
MNTSLRKVVWTILCGVVFISTVTALLQLRRGKNVQQEVEDTRRALRGQGFKTDLADFNFHTDAAMQSREMALTFFSYTVQPATALDTINLLPAVADDSAMVVWKNDWLKGENGNVSWADVRDSLAEIRPQLDAACDAALAGPIQFDLEASHGSAMLLRHLAALKKLAQTLGCRAMLELQDGNTDAAFTNLLAQSRLITAWEPEPSEISHLVRFGCVTFAFNSIWQALQTNGWSDEQLSRLQQEWTAPDFFKPLPDTMAFKRAYVVADCQRERNTPIPAAFTYPDFFKEAMHSPMLAFAELKNSWSQARYRSYGAYEDETALLLFYRDREVELQNAVKSLNWEMMRQLPGVTNFNPFISKYHSRLQAMMNLKELRAVTMRPGSSFLGRAADAEARRRIIVTAFALERYHGKHGAYPNELAGIAPEFLNAAPVDFMDGQPLRYRLTADGHFVLYSVGLDCVDNGGKMRDAKRRDMFDDGRDFMGLPREPDIVWPRPASAPEVETWHRAQLAALQNKADEVENLQATAQWEHTARHQADLDMLLAAPAVTNVPDIVFLNSHVSDTLRNSQLVGTNKLSLVQMLTLKQSITGEEPETVTFQLSIAYDALTNFGELHLYIDPTNNDDSDIGCNVMQMETKRAASGDCLLVWSTLYESPGRHALQAGLTLSGLPPDKQDFDGPLLPFTTTNLIQFSLGSATYDVDHGATFHARLPEANGQYSIECVTTNGEHLKTLTGSTSNGEFNVVWNLVDDHGQRLAGETFNSIVHVTLPDSGRSQTLRGP